MKTLTILTLTLLLSACGPLYRVRYTYTPPSTEEGNRCLNTCISINQSCVSSVESNYNWCIANCLNSYNACRLTSKFCWNLCPAVCPLDYTPCNGSYNACYKNCGGVVHKRTVCVRGCN